MCVETAAERVGEEFLDDRARELVAPAGQQVADAGRAGELRAVGQGCGRVNRRARIERPPFADGVERFQALADLAGLLEVLQVDAGRELRVLTGQLGTRQQRVLQLVDVLGERALLRSGRAVELGAR